MILAVAVARIGTITGVSGAGRIDEVDEELDRLPGSI